MKIFSDKLLKLWNEWDLRVMVLISLSLQMILILLGNRRKYIASNWIRMIIWLSYLSADWVATVSLGILCNNLGNSNSDSSKASYVIMAFWAPFLLLHLGGPDTITAYSLEDNELWHRHALGLVIQVGVTVYVFLRSWDQTQLNFVAIPMFVAGIVKYGERTWVLWSASSQHFRKSLLPPPDPGPNYAKFTEEYTSKETEGYVLSWVSIQAPRVAAHTISIRGNDRIPEATIFNAAYDFFKTYKRLFADLILSFQDLEKSRCFFQSCCWDEAFKVIEIELGFVYDVLYTKAIVVHSLWGSFLRFTTISCTVIAFAAFCMIGKSQYSKFDVGVSFLLLLGAIGLEIYAILMLLSSDWIMLWLSKHENLAVNVVHKAVSSFKCLRNRNRWSNYMEQHNLINSFFKGKPAKYSRVFQRNGIHQVLENYGNGTTKRVCPCLKQNIFERLMEKSRGASDLRLCKKLCASRGEQILENSGCLDKLGWSLEVEFDHCILLWHIATDLCHSSDHKRDSTYVLHPNCEASKLLSDYMLYILVNRPFMLPNGIGQIRFQDTVAEAMKFIQERKSITNASLACERLLQVDTRIPPGEVKGDRSKSVLFEACRLAKTLQSLEAEENWTNGRKWKMISNIWVDILSSAATQCRWNHHAQQLRQGGELLTHVWLLMAHLGLTEQFQISQGHARAKLVVQ